MIKLSLNIRLPFDIKFKNFWCKSWTTPFEHKFIELEVYTTNNVVGVNFDWTIRRDHAGIDIQLSLFGYCLHFNLYDNRHWDYKTNNWETY